MLRVSLWLHVGRHSSQSVDGIPENVTYFHRNDNLELTTGTCFHADCIYERPWVVDVVCSKAPKTLSGRHVKGLSLIRYRLVLNLDRAYCLGQRCVATSLLILLGSIFQPGARNRGSGRLPELAESQTLDGHHRCFDSHMGQLIPFEMNFGQMKTTLRWNNGAYNRNLWVLVFYGTYGRFIVVCDS